MSWYENSGQDDATVLFTQVGLHRNLEKYPFSSCLDAKGANEMITAVGGLLTNNGFHVLNFADISPANAVSYVESLEASTSFVRSNTPHALALNQPCNLSVMLCEEDHLIIQCIQPGLNTEGAYANVRKVEEIVDHSYPIAYDKDFGYLTQNPAMHGTGMQITAILFLPLLHAENEVESICRRIAPGLCLTPFYRENGLYALSTAMAVGQTEETMQKLVTDTVTQLKNTEAGLLSRLMSQGDRKEELIARVLRARALATGSYLLTEAEFLHLCADLRLGVCAGIIKDIPAQALTALLINCMPAHLYLGTQDPPKTERERDRLRAQTAARALTAG